MHCPMLPDFVPSSRYLAKLNYWPIAVRPKHVPWLGVGAAPEDPAGVTKRTTLSSTAQNSFTPVVLAVIGTPSTVYVVAGVPAPTAAK